MSIYIAIALLVTASVMLIAVTVRFFEARSMLARRRLPVCKLELVTADLAHRPVQNAGRLLQEAVESSVKTAPASDLVDNTRLWGESPSCVNALLVQNCLAMSKEFRELRAKDYLPRMWIWNAQLELDEQKALAELSVNNFAIRSDGRDESKIIGFRCSMYGTGTGILPYDPRDM